MKSFLVVAACCLSFNSQAGDVFTVSGLGTNSCGSYIAAINTRFIDQGMTYQGESFYPKSGVYAQWLAGFVSASNWAKNPESQDQTDLNGLTLWVKNYCEAHPDMPIVKAAVDFINRNK